LGESGASVSVPNQAKEYAERDKEGREGGMAVFMQSVSSMSRNMDEQRMSVTTMQVIGSTHTHTLSESQGARMKSMNTPNSIYKVAEKRRRV
jgi:hypothetical protein